MALKKLREEYELKGLDWRTRNGLFFFSRSKGANFESPIIWSAYKNYGFFPQKECKWNHTQDFAHNFLSFCTLPEVPPCTLDVESQIYDSLSHDFMVSCPQNGTHFPICFIFSGLYFPIQNPYLWCFPRSNIKNLKVINPIPTTPASYHDLRLWQFRLDFESVWRTLSWCGPMAIFLQADGISLCSYLL